MGYGPSSWRVPGTRRDWSVDLKGVMGQVPGECQELGETGLSILKWLWAKFLERVPRTRGDWSVDLKGVMGQVPGEFYKGRSQEKTVLRWLEPNIPRSSSRVPGPR